ncbi:OsmC family protein [Alkalicella caledoniensis]|uniref:OsmC family protein n=2 Tax=Alkalicella caledoniensis TaxID=2731377 RepID=A0A7G9WDH9_ALKCA|nr:OsmC family protein [Alkalicella caledoniensis]
MKTTVKWKNGMKFVGVNEHNTEVLMDIDDITGVRPMQMALMSIGGCTAVDVISTLEKMRQNVEGMEIEIEGLRRDEHPRYFEEIVIVYKFKGDLDGDKVERAIKLSKDKYCSVSNMFEPKAKISFRFEINK